MSNQVVTRKATPDEVKKYNIKTTLTEVEWFMDEHAPSVPSIGISTNGISFNTAACRKVGFELGEFLQIGINNGLNRLVMVKGSEGLRIRKNSDNGSLMVVNSRLIEWLEKKNIVRKRYALQYDELSGSYYTQLEAVERGIPG